MGIESKEGEPEDKRAVMEDVKNLLWHASVESATDEDRKLAIAEAIKRLNEALED